tara:strand:+ start:652 stop:765 length:114 start_codon:yes stop_codon:yes gene_type:complete
MQQPASDKREKLIKRIQKEGKYSAEMPWRQAVRGVTV